MSEQTILGAGAATALGTQTLSRSDRRHGPKGAARREAILDAAEKVFSERGYQGASMREVSAHCGAALGLINHYFASKTLLFETVIARRLPVLREAVAVSLAEAVHKNAADARAIIRAFIAPFLRAVAHDDQHLRTYTRMISLLMTNYHVAEIRPALASLKSVSDLLADALRPALPQLEDEQLKVALYLIEAALIFMVQDTGFLDTLSSGSFDTERIDLLLEPAATLFAAGTAALASPSGMASRTPVLTKS